MLRRPDQVFQASRQLSVVTTLAMVFVLAGCASSEDDEAVRAAEQFAGAVTAQDASAACAVLAPATMEELEQSSGKPCIETVLEEAVNPGTRGRVSTFGSMSQVQFADDVVFLARFDGGWRVVAASCRPKRGGPYSCGIEGR